MKKISLKRYAIVAAVLLLMVTSAIGPAYGMIQEEGIIPGKITVSNVEAGRTVYAYAIGYETDDGYVLSRDFDGTDIVVDFKNPTQEQMNAILDEYKAWDAHTGSSLKGKTYYKMVYDEATGTYVLPYGCCSDGAYMIVVDDGAEYIEKIVFVEGMPEDRAGEGDANVSIYKDGAFDDTDVPAEDPNEDVLVNPPVDDPADVPIDDSTEGSEEDIPADDTAEKPNEDPNAAKIAELTVQLEEAKNVESNAIETLFAAKAAYNEAKAELSSATSELSSISKEMSAARSALARARIESLLSRFGRAKINAQAKVNEAQELVQALQEDYTLAQKNVVKASNNVGIASKNVLVARRDVDKATAAVKNLQYQLDQLV